MGNKDNSRFLSLVLRHKPDNISITLDRNGWVSVDDLLRQMKTNNREISMMELKELVEFNDKKRFEFNEDESKIRASQGHSVKVDLNLKAERPPMKLYHGTVDKFIENIMKNGLNKMNRHAVHLSDSITTATKVGSRRGNPIILLIDSAAMFTDKIKFYKSTNGVWLTEEVLPKYIKLKQ